MIRLAARALLLLPCLPSCAATFASGPTMVSVSSDPSGATVLYEGQQVGVTPCTVAMRNRDTVLVLQLAGYWRREADVGLSGNFGLMFIGILLWGPLEVIAAGLTDTCSSPNDAHVHVELAPADAAPLPQWTRTRRTADPHVD